MKNIALLILSLCCLCLSSTAQTPQATPSPKGYTIKGTVVDSVTGKGVGFVTVILKDSTTSVKAIAADGNGSFTIKHNKQGKYTLNVSYIGYGSVDREVTLDAQPMVNLGNIPVSEGVQLEAAVVIGQLITSDIDKVSYNLAADPETPALTGLEMMRKVPMLSVDGDDNIKLKGDENYKILVNGKTNSMMSKNYKEVLRSMPASSIKNIEVITNPPAKYDAEGLSGIINIVTVRKTNNSYNGSLSIRGDQWGSIGGGGYIAASLGKFSLSANVYGGRYLRPGVITSSETVNEKSESTRYMNTSGSSDMSSTSYSMGLDASYEIDTFNLISLSMWGFLGDNVSDGISQANYYDINRVLTQGYVNNQTSKNKYGSISGNIDWQRSFMKPDETLTVSYRLDMNPGGSSYTSMLDGFGGYLDRHQRSENNSNGGEHTIQIDYFNPLTKVHNIEVGVKFVLRPNTSDTYNEKYENENWIEDLARKNDLDYMQYITSAYAGYQLKLKKFSVKVGLRMEYTVNTGIFKLANGNNEVFNRYFNVVPYVTTSYKINDSQNLRLGYTQRLQRPGIWYLNPYINDQDPMNISTGNPDLESEIRHSFDLSYNTFSKLGNISASLSANFGNNAVERVTTIDNKGVMFTAPQNCGKRQNYNAYVYGRLNMLNNKMSLSLNAGVGYSIVESTANSALNNEGFSFNGNLYFNSQLWKNANVNVGAGYYSSSVNLQSTSSSNYYHSIGLSQSFLKDKKLRVNLNVSNPFETEKVFSSENYGDGYNSFNETIIKTRSINLSLQWNFGKMMTQVKKARRGISNDDKMSGGGSEQSSSN